MTTSLQALIDASGHTEEDARRILRNLRVQGYVLVKVSADNLERDFEEIVRDTIGHEKFDSAKAAWSEQHKSSSTQGV